MSGGCSQMQLQRTEEITSQTILKEDRQLAFAFGVLPYADIVESTACPNQRLVAIETFQSASDVGIYLVTLGVVRRQTAKIQCASK